MLQAASKRKSCSAQEAFKSNVFKIDHSTGPVLLLGKGIGFEFLVMN